MVEEYTPTPIEKCQKAVNEASTGCQALATLVGTISSGKVPGIDENYTAGQKGKLKAQAAVLYGEIIAALNRAKAEFGKV